MKINTITCHRVYNHGAALQAWALATFLKMEGHEVNIIDYRPDYLCGHFEWGVNNPIFDKPIVRWLYLAAKYPGWKRSLSRKAVFDVFDKKFIAPLVTRRCYLAAEELKQNPPIADVYIAGSDQIWNTTFKNGTDPSFYLDFATLKNLKLTKTISNDFKPKLLSYAASFATEQLKEGTEDFVKLKLTNFDAVSVRELSGMKLLESIGYNGTLVCDPVFLIDADIWVSLIATREGEGESYILVYDVEGSKDIQVVAQRLAKVKGLKIYYIGSRNKRYADKNYVNYAPDSFVSLIKNSTYVVSNSFHATAFSFIFQKQVYVVKRGDGLNTRMQDLLGRYDIVDRLVDANSNFETTIDYRKVNVILQQEIVNSKAWLLSQIMK